MNAPGRLAWVAVLGLGAGLVAGPARAGQPGPTGAEPDRGSSAADPQGSSQFAEGRQLYKDGKFAEALPRFEQALAASGSPNARLYLARTLRELGRLTEAYEAMRATLNDARARAETEPRYTETRDSAAAELALLESKVGRLIVALTALEPGTAVTLDGAPVPKNRLGHPIGVEPGMHTVVVSAPGKPELRREVSVAPGATQTIALSLETGRAPPKEAAPQAPADEPSAFGPVRIAGIVVAAVGLGGLVVYAVSAAEAKSSYDTLDSECAGQRCTDPVYADEVDYGETMELVSHVSLAVGLAAVVAGGVMIVIGDGDAPVEQTAAVGLRAGGPWLGYEARF